MPVRDGPYRIERRVILRIDDFFQVFAIRRKNRCYGYCWEGEAREMV